MSGNVLIECGIIQGAYLDCSKLNDQARKEIQLGRALENKRQSPVESYHKLIVLSQSCDINSNREKSIELATAKVIPFSKTDSAIQKTRNLKKLHIFVGDECWEVESELIAIVPKTVLSAIGQLQVCDTVGNDNLEILTQWRVNRYTREPLPDNFNRALLSDYLHRNETGLDDFLSANRSKILGIYAFVDPNDKEDAVSYQVSLTMVLKVQCTDDDVNELALEFKKHINAIHQADNCLSMLQADGGEGFHPDITNMELVCLPAYFSFEDAICMRRLTLDFLCWDEIANVDSSGGG